MLEPHIHEVLLQEQNVFMHSTACLIGFQDMILEQEASEIFA